MGRLGHHMRARGLRFYAITTLLGFGIIWASAVYLALIGFRGNPAECSSSCVIGAIPAGLGWLLLSFCGHRAYLLFFTGSRNLSEKRVESLEIGNGTEEQQILEIVREILIHRRVVKRLRNVETLAWSDIQTWQTSRFKWQGYGKPSMLVLSMGLRGRLEIEDWRTYMNWCYARLNVRQTLYVAQPVVRALLPMLLVAAATGTVDIFAGQYWFGLVGSTFGPPIILLTIYRVASAFRRVFLRIDAKAAESLGPMILLALFKKMETLHLQENENAEKRTGWIARLWPEPNITERIANLQRTSLGS